MSVEINIVCSSGEVICTKDGANPIYYLSKKEGIPLFVMLKDACLLATKLNAQVHTYYDDFYFKIEPNNESDLYWNAFYDKNNHNKPIINIVEKLPSVIDLKEKHIEVIVKGKQYLDWLKEFITECNNQQFHDGTFKDHILMKVYALFKEAGFKSKGIESFERLKENGNYPAAQYIIGRVMFYCESFKIPSMDLLNLIKFYNRELTAEEISTFYSFPSIY